MRILWLFLLLVVGTVSAQAADSYRRYTNARFGTSVLYPSNLLSPRPESQNGDGRQFWSRDGKISLRVFASHNVQKRGTAAQMSRVREDWKTDGGRVTYAKSGRDWFVLSGFVEGDIFYEKTVLKNGVFHTMIWEYPKSMRSRMDAPVTRTVQAFTPNSVARPLR